MEEEEGEVKEEGEEEKEAKEEKEEDVLGKSKGVKESRSSFLGSILGKKKSSGSKTSPAPPPVRVEAAYYGKRTDARDRSSEDPRRHSIPRLQGSRRDSSSSRGEGPGDSSPSAAAAAFSSATTPTKKKVKKRSKERSSPPSKETPPCSSSNSQVLRSLEDLSPHKKRKSLGGEEKTSGGFFSRIRSRRNSNSSLSSVERAVAQSPKKPQVVNLSSEEAKKKHRSSSLSHLLSGVFSKKSKRRLSENLLSTTESSPSHPAFHSTLIAAADASLEHSFDENLGESPPLSLHSRREVSPVHEERGRATTPDPDYDRTSVLSSESSLDGASRGGARPKFSSAGTRYPPPRHFHHPRASSSEFNISFNRAPTPSSPSPRLSHRAPSSDSFFGRHLGSTSQTQLWYQSYQSDAFSHRDTVFGDISGGSSSSVDGRMSHIKDEQERVQKKTFVNWINSYLSKHSPSMSIVDLIEDLKDGSKLLALLEVLSGESLPVEKGRLLKRPHFLSNCNTALEFLKSKRIKLVNINASDLVDGRPPVVLGLIWTIILYFQIEENTRVLEKLGQRYGSPYAEYRPRSQIGYSTDDSSDDRASRKVNEKWKAGAKRALLQWCQSHVTKKSGVPIQDFGRSWRDGNAFLGMINGIKPGVVDIKSMAKENNKTRLETAFYAAESKLGIARLLDPEDVDVENPDEKSVMTYVAQFLHRYPEGEEVEFRERFTSVESQFSELRQWLRTKIQLFDTVHQGKTKPNFMRNFSDYEKFKMEVREKKVVYDRLRQVMESNNKIIGIDSDAWKEVDMNWQKIQAQVRHWQWLLDTALPGEFGQVGEWLNQAEALVYGDDVPTVLNEEAATLLNQKIEEHKNFFSHLHSVKKQFEEALNFSPLVHEISEGQINSINMRLQGIGPLSEVRAVKLRFLEHKCCIVAFLVLTESRLKNWTIKYGKEDKVQQIIHQYRTFISKNKVFHEFEKAFQEFEQVCLEYKEHGNIDQEEADQIGRFIREIAKRWKDTSTELRCVQSLLEEVLTYWKRWNTLAPEFRRYLNTGFEVLHKGDEDQRQNFFYDVSAWRDKHSSLQDTVAFLIATCDPSVGKELSDELNAMSTDWERLYNSGGKDYVHGSDINRIKQDYDEGLESLDRWLRRAENLLSQKQSLNFASEVKSSLDSMMALHAEIVPMEDVFKNISKKFQLLARELSQDDIKKMMFVLKKEKENLVIVRSMIPSKLQLFHHLFTQLEAIDENERKIVEWCEATNQLLDMPSAKSSKEFMTRSEKIKRAVSSVTSLQGSLQSLKNVFQGVLKNVENKDDFEVSKLKNRIATVVDTFGSTVDRLKDFEMKILKENEALEDFREVQKCAEAWIVEGESLMLVRNFESKETVLKHKEFFGHPKNDELMKRFLQSASNLKPYLHSAEEKEEISQKVEEIKSKWKDISERAPLHLAKAKFRLVEETLEKHLKEIEKYIADESLAFQRGDHHEIEDIIKNHNEYFEFNPVVQEAKKCLDQLQALSSCKEAQGNAELKKNYEIRNQQWAVLMEKHMKFSSFLEQVPEQWNEYESKFDQMTNWMNSVDLALEKIFREEPTPEGFNLEKEKFELLCNDIDSKREDMKWLVQSLNQLMSNRPNEEGLSEQNRLEKLVTRYKSIIPLIDTTRQKIDAFTKSYLFKNDVQEVQTSMSALGSQVQEINDLQKEKESLDAWISNQENLVAEMFKKSAKYRSDAAQTEIQSIINLRQSLVEKQAVIDDIELRQSVSPNYIPDHNSKIALDTLDEHIGMLLDKKNNQFLMMEDYRSAVSESQAWFEMISKSIEDLEVGSGITGEIKLKKVKEIEKEYDLNKDRPSLIKEKANIIIKEVGDMDCQHIEEQSCSIQRRMVELQKRINRKKQIIYMALEGYNDTDSNIVVVKDWLESNIEYVNESQKNLPSDVSNLQKYISSLTSLSKEVDSKVLYIDNLENKLNTIKADLEPEESVHLAQKLSSLRDKKKVLAKLLQDGLNRTSIYVQEKVDFDTNSENIKTLLNSMSSEFQTCAEWNPLKSHSVEKRIVKLKKIESEVKELEETEVSKLNRSVLSLSKSGSSENIQKTVKEIQDSLKSLKSQIKDKIVSMETLIEPRKGFEADLEMCFNWLNKSETGISSEIRGTPNVAVLEQHLSKFKDVKGEEEPYRKNISKLLAYGNSILPTLSDSDRLTLQSKLDELCDRLNQVVEALNKKMEDLVESIDRYRAATSKIEVNVAQLSKVQSEILALNKPIGYKIEDAESVYRAYEKILEDLRKFKAQIEELNRTSGANVYELRSILQQQEELILSIENQMTRMKGLIITRQQYSSLVTGLTEFIINYTEIVKEIERSNIQPSEKVKRYDEAISKITDSEAQLAMASDKGQLIASEGSVQDRNQVMDQLQSLKNQVHSLKKAIQKKREEHVQSASETKKLVEEIEAVLEKLRNRETPVQSRPILTSAVANVEEKIIEHDSLVNEVKTYLSKLKDLCDSAQALGEESSLCSVRSSALALLHSIPLELDERRVYLEDNKTYRLSYDNAVQRLNTWIEEAQMKLRLYVDGVDFENLENELDEHKKYFGQETKLRDLLNQISENAGKIRPSLSPQCQEKLSHEEKFFNQLVKNTLNSALSQQGIIEKNCRMWRVFQRFLKDEDFNFDDHSAPDRINCLPSLKKSIIKLQPEIDKLEEKRLKLDKLKENAKSVQKVADVLNRNKIDKELSAIEEAFRNKLTRLKEKKENATALVVQWEDFESKHKNFEALLNKLISQLTSGDVTFRSFEQMISMRSSLNKLKEDARISDSKRKDVLVLSSNVLTMLNEYPSSSCKSEIEDRVTSVSKKYNKLLEDIDNKLKMINEEIQSIEEADKKSDELGNKLFKLNNDIQKIDIWTQDEDCETHLLNYKGQVDSTFAEAQNLNSNLRRKYQEFGQSLPADISEKLSGLEISFENLHSQLDEKLRDLKRARSIRSGFIGDVEVIQSWIQSAEAKINNRSGDPQSLKERVQEAFSELSEMANRTENLNKNGNILINKTKNPSEKDLIISTVDNLTEQMTQVRHVIEEKKIAANEAIDSWFKFFQLYENVIGWCGEKKAILKEPLKFNNLSQELQEFLNAKKSLKYISKDIQEMNRELVKINNICDSEDLGDKLNEAEALKTETEAHLTERTAMIQELTEEWDQCERKLKEIEVWIGDCQKTLNSIQNKKRPIREQFALRERATGDVTIARTKISMAMEKLKVHFREENMSDNDIVERVSILEKKLNGLESVLKEENVVLGSSLNQLEAYHADVSRLRQRIITEEQSLRTVMNPAYVSKNKDKALTEQASCRERIRNIQSKITAFNERIKLINQRATPDPTPLKYDFPH